MTDEVLVEVVGDAVVVEVSSSTVDIVESAESAVEVLELPVGPPGPRGRTGPTGSLGLHIGIAGQNLSGHRVVTLDPASAAMVYAQPSDQVAGPLWTTTGAALEGQEIQAVRFGEITEPSWNWTPGEHIYIAPDGLLVNVPPTSAAILRYAVSLSPTTIYIDPFVPIVLSA